MKAYALADEAQRIIAELGGSDALDSAYASFETLSKGFVTGPNGFERDPRGYAHKNPDPIDVLMNRVRKGVVQAETAVDALKAAAVYSFINGDGVAHQYLEAANSMVIEPV